MGHGPARVYKVQIEEITIEKRFVMVATVRLLAFVTMVVLWLPAKAQDDPEYRLEIGAGAGLAGYLGDYNGNLTKDLQPAASILGRYNLNPWMALRLNIGFGRLKGSSKDVKTWYAANSGNAYSFSNNFYDITAAYEYNFWPYGTGRDYRGAKRLTPFVLGGMGVVAAKTKVKTRVAMTVPLGVGVKYKISDRVNLGLEWATCFSTSDWLDGVKDPDDIRSSGMFKNTDGFQRLQLSVTYCFSPRCLNCNKE